MKTQISRLVLVAAVTVGLLCSVAKTVRADEWNDHQQHARDWHERHFHHHDHDHPVVVEEPNVVYAPPVVVEAPPAPADDAPSGLNLIFPINIH